MKRIVFITGSLPPIRCGIGYYSQNLLERMTTDGIKPHVITSHGTDSLPSLELTRAAWRLRDLPHLMQIIKQQSPEIVHIQYPAVGYGHQLGINLLPFCLRLASHTEVIVTLHEYHGSPFWGRMRNLVTVFAAHKIIVSNEADRQKLPVWLRRKVSVIPIGSNISRAPRDSARYKAIMKNAGLDASLPTVMFFGFAVSTKGLEILLDAIRLVPDLQLLMLTSLDPSDAYQKRLLAKISDIGSRVGVTGFLSDKDVSVSLQEGDYFVLPQPLALTAKSGTALAAVTHGLVVIAKGAKPARFSLPFVDQKNSLLLNSMDAESLATALRAAQKSPSAELRAAITELSKHFDWANIVTKHRDLYGE